MGLVMVAMAAAVREAPSRGRALPPFSESMGKMRWVVDRAIAVV
jgi:hypothetical protein